MKNVTLVVMAAGIGSRLAAESSSWSRSARMVEIIMDYLSMMP